MLCAESTGDLEVSGKSVQACSGLTGSSQINILRRQGGNRLSVFAPANDLSLISRSSDYIDGHPVRSRAVGGVKPGIDVQGGKVLGDEWAEHVVKNRNGIMLRAS